MPATKIAIAPQDWPGLLRRFNKGDREIADLHYRQQWSLDKIEATTGKRRKTIQQSIYRARDVWREVLPEGIWREGEKGCLLCGGRFFSPSFGVRKCPECRAAKTDSGPRVVSAGQDYSRDWDFPSPGGGDI